MSDSIKSFLYIKCHKSIFHAVGKYDSFEQQLKVKFKYINPLFAFSIIVVNYLGLAKRQSLISKFFDEFQMAYWTIISLIEDILLIVNV